ncbi:hypothetical protein HCN44_006840 [Aphidius gifuensis]|uniref:Uncharacterized protein n=1 Tax=Aphidius gifuensis TaxID=684658 RepID=A0A835CVV3_APHGI|nr:uncharacterized protein LOC122850654 [Aphidius gifuensis]KAF7995733.1 hypothetical protein HCN44_006840 [Aphidius gifuensis]
MKEKSSKSFQDIVKIKNDQDNIKMINENSKESNVICPADKKQIEKMINDLEICKLAKKNAEIQIVDLETKNEFLQNRYELLCSKHEDEKCKLKSKLLETTGQLNNLRVQTSNCLDTLTQQVESQKKEYLKLAETINDLLCDKIQLENSLKIMKNQVKRSQEIADVSKLLLLNNEQLKLIDDKKIHQECQTDSSIN